MQFPISVTNLAPILHRFRDIAFATCLTPLTDGFPWGRSRIIFTERSGMAKVPNGVETLPKISIAWVARTNVTDDRQTDDRRTGDDIANVNVSSRSLKTEVHTPQIHNAHVPRRLLSLIHFCNLLYFSLTGAPDWNGCLSSRLQRMRGPCNCTCTAVINAHCSAISGPVQCNVNEPAGPARVYVTSQGRERVRVVPARRDLYIPRRLQTCQLTRPKCIRPAFEYKAGVICLPTQKPAWEPIFKYSKQ